MVKSKTVTWNHSSTLRRKRRESSNARNERIFIIPGLSGVRTCDSSVACLTFSGIVFF